MTYRKNEDPEKRKAKAARRKRRKEAIANGAQMMPRQKRPQAQMDHGCNPKGSRHAREGEKAMHRERSERSGEGTPDTGVEVQGMVLRVPGAQEQRAGVSDAGGSAGRGDGSLQEGESEVMWYVMHDHAGLRHAHSTKNLHDGLTPNREHLGVPKMTREEFQSLY